MRFTDAPAPQMGSRWPYLGSYAGTRWYRKSDGVKIRIERDSQADFGHGTRSLEALNLESRRKFRVTPEGLHRKYKHCVDNDEDQA